MSIPLGTAQALKLWHDVSLAQVHGHEADLSVRQVTILLTIYMEAPPHTIRDLAKKLKVSKPVVTGPWIQWENLISWRAAVTPPTAAMSWSSAP